MSRMLIGSSNIYQFYKPEKFTGYKKHKMVACTNMETFRVAMDEIEDTKGGVIISVVENFVCRAIREAKDEAKKEEVSKEVEKEYLEVIRICATNCPRRKFAIVQPMRRPMEPWYTENQKHISKRIEEGIKEMDLGNVAKIGSSVEQTQLFEKDGIHLTSPSGKVFVDAILFYGDEFFSADFIDLEKEPEENTTKEKEVVEDISDSNLDKRVMTLETEVGKIKEDLRVRRFHDSLVTARIREELDMIINERKEG